MKASAAQRHTRLPILSYFYLHVSPAYWPREAEAVRTSKMTKAPEDTQEINWLAMVVYKPRKGAGESGEVG